MKIVVLGFGRMGAWLSRVLSKSHAVSVYDTDVTKVPAPPIGHLDRLEDVARIAPDVLVNAVTLDKTVAVFAEVVRYLPDSCILCDVASIKGRLAEYYKETGKRFVSLHPMFGPTFADMMRVEGENGVIITGSCAEGRKLFEELFETLGVRVFDYSFEEHDRMMAYSLSTPFIASLVFASCVDAKTVPGTTFTRHMAIARKLLTEDDSLLEEILFNPYSLGEIERITSRLEFLKHVIKAQDADEARRFFRRLRENVGTKVG